MNIEELRYLEEKRAATLTPEELSKRLRVSVATLKDWRLDGKGPIWRKVGGRIRYPLKRVEDWEAQQERGTTKEVCEP